MGGSLRAEIAAISSAGRLDLGSVWSLLADLFLDSRRISKTSPGVRGRTDSPASHDILDGVTDKTIAADCAGYPRHHRDWRCGHSVCAGGPGAWIHCG